MSDQDKAEWPRHTLIEEDSHQAVSRIYVHPPSMQKFKSDVAAFVDATAR